MSNINDYTLEFNYKTESYELVHKIYCRSCGTDITTFARDSKWYDTCEGCKYKKKCEEDRPKIFQERIKHHMIKYHWLLYNLSFGIYRCSENCHCIKI